MLDMVTNHKWDEGNEMSGTNQVNVGERRR